MWRALGTLQTQCYTVFNSKNTLKLCITPKKQIIVSIVPLY